MKKVNLVARYLESLFTDQFSMLVFRDKSLAGAVVARVEGRVVFPIVNATVREIYCFMRRGVPQRLATFVMHDGRMFIVQVRVSVVVVAAAAAAAAAAGKRVP